MTKIWLAYSTKLAAGCSMLALSAAATAQNADSDFALEEIVVTAQKREQSLQDVPISVTAISGDRVGSFAAGGEDIRLLSSRIPGLNAESSNGRVAPRFYIRGLGNTDFDLAASQPVSIIMDDVVKENVILKSFPLFDIERVEVLRGPQGTLFGRNTPAGIVKFDTRKPSQETEGYVNASYGSYNTATVEAAAGGALSDKAAVRVSGLYQRRSDYIDNPTTGIDDEFGDFEELAARVQLLLEPSDNFEILANFHVRSYEGTSTLFRTASIDRGTNDLNDRYQRDQYFSDETHGNPQEYDNWGASLKLVYDFANDVTLTSITAYETADGFSLGDISGEFPGGSTQDGLDELDQFTEELRLSGQAGDRVFWQVGFFYFDSDFTVLTDPGTDGIPGAPQITSVRHQNETWALFGQVSYDLTEDTTLTAGLRYTDDEKSLDSTRNTLGIDFSTDLQGDEFSWDLALNHIVDDDLSIYARVARGFRAPTIQGRDLTFFGVPSTADEETIMSYELGFKADLLDGRMRWNGSAYYYDVSGLQLTATGGSGNFISLVNAEEAIGYGIETDVEVLITESFSITSGFAWNFTEINDPNTSVGVCADCTVLDPLNADGFASIDGNRLPNAPEWTFNFVGDYTTPVGDGEMFISADLAVQGPTDIFLYESVEFHVDTTFELGARAGYRWGDGQYEVAAFGRNITGEDNVKGAVDFINNTVFVNEPAIFGVSFGVNF